MGHIRQRKLKEGGVRYQAEIRLKGNPTITATFDRRTDAKAWIQKTEANIRCGRHQLYSEGKRHTLKEAIARYAQEQQLSKAKQGHLLWWQAQFGALYLQDIRPSIISEKKQKLLSEINTKGKIRTGSTCNRYLATLSHLMSICAKQWEWISENPIKKITREKESRERTRFLSPDERKRLLEACQKSDNPLLTLFVVLLLSTGCRYNEIKSLKWTNIDLTKGRIGVKSFAEPIEDTQKDYSGFKGIFHSTRFPAPPLTFSLSKSGLPQLIRQDEALPTYPLSNGRLFVPSLGLELELIDRGTLTVYEGGRATNEIVKKT